MQSRQHTDQHQNKSELDRLIDMPGFNRMKAEIYFNMMGARPDPSANNVRIHSEMELKKQRAAQEAAQSSALDDSKEGRRMTSMPAISSASPEHLSPYTKADKFKAEIEARRRRLCPT